MPDTFGPWQVQPRKKQAATPPATPAAQVHAAPSIPAPPPAPKQAPRLPPPPPPPAMESAETRAAPWAAVKPTTARGGFFPAGCKCHPCNALGHVLVSAQVPGCGRF